MVESVCSKVSGFAAKLTGFHLRFTTFSHIFLHGKHLAETGAALYVNKFLYKLKLNNINLGLAY